MPYVLDTDIISALQRNHPEVLARLRAVSASTLFVTIVSFEEQSAGRLSVLSKQARGQKLIDAYRRLQQMLAFYAAANMLPYDAEAARIDDDLRVTLRRMGTKDRRIAAISLAHRAILVTRNTVDFQHVPELGIEDWTTPAPT